MLPLWLATALAGTCSGFVGPFGAGEWSTSGSPDWVIDGTSSTATMSYVVPDAPAPFSTFLVGASVSDVDDVQFDWTYDYNHGYFDTEALLEVSTDQGDRVLHEGTGIAFEGPQAASGSESIDLRGVDTLGLRVEGDNFDGGTGLSGSVVLTGLTFSSDLCDCAGAFEGEAVEDPCGTCDADPTNDCVEDCAGVWGGTASLDACGDCVGGTTGRDPCSPSTDTPTEPPITSGTDSGLPSTTPSTDRTASGTTLPATHRAVDGCGCASRPSMQVWGLFTRRR